MPGVPGEPDDPPLAADPDAEDELGIRLVGVVLIDPPEEAAAAAADALPPAGIDSLEFTVSVICLARSATVQPNSYKCCKSSV